MVFRVLEEIANNLITKLYIIEFSKNFGTVETAFSRSPLGAEKNSRKRQVVYEPRVAKKCPCKVNTFLLLEFEAESIF